MKYKPQTSDDIRLYIISGDPDIQQFKVLKTGELMWNSLTVTYGILGESHFITLKGEGVIFSEICACIEGKFRTVPHKHVPINELLKSEVQFSGTNFLYAINAKRFYDKEAKVELKKLRERMNSTNSRSLINKFPKKHFFAKHSITEIFIQTLEDKLSISSVHTYPEESSIVFTNSTISLI